MADKRTGPGDAARRGKRAAPTIDLTAADVTPAPASEPAPAVDPQPQAAQPPPQQQAPPPTEPDRPNAAGQTPIGEQPRKRAGVFAMFAAGTTGAALTAVVLVALWLSGVVQSQQSVPATAPDTKAIDALSQRVSKIEDALKNLPPADAGLADRVAAADNAMRALGLALTALNKHSDDVAATATQARERADAAEKAVGELRASVQELNKDAAKNASPGISAIELDALQKRLAALEQSAKDSRDDIAKATSTDNATRLALAAVALREAVESGAPFAAEFAQAQVLSSNDIVLTPLAEFATSGVPSAQALAQELRALLPGLAKAKASDAQPSGNFLERLQANATKLVHKIPVDAPAGDDPSAVLARLEVEAAKADIPAAVADLGKLANPTEATQRWIGKAKVREAALAAARQFAAATARSLGAR